MSKCVCLHTSPEHVPYLALQSALEHEKKSDCEFGVNVLVSQSRFERCASRNRTLFAMFFAIVKSAPGARLLIRSFYLLYIYNIISIFKSNNIYNYIGRVPVKNSNGVILPALEVVGR